jgi:7tm Chemosensory receptor
MNALAQSFKQLYIFSKLCGVMPVSFDSRTKQFRRSRWAQMHTVILLGLSTLAYPSLINEFVERVDLSFKAQPIGANIVVIYRYVNVGMLVTLTLQLHYQNCIIELLNNGLRIAKVLLEHTSESYGSRFYKLHLLQLAMSFSWWIMLTLLLLSYFIDPDYTDVLYAIAVVSPVMMGMTAMSAVFMLSAGLLLRGYTRICEQIKLLLQQPTTLTKQCQLSDDLDLLKTYFRQLNDLLRTLVQVLAVPIFFFISISFAGAVRGVKKSHHLD